MILSLPDEPKQTHDLVEDFLSRREMTFDQILKPKFRKDHAARNSLICELAKTGMTLKRIHTIAGCTQDYAQRVLDFRDVEEPKMKTMEWG